MELSHDARKGHTSPDNIKALIAAFDEIQNPADLNILSQKADREPLDSPDRLTNQGADTADKADELILPAGLLTINL